MPYPIQTEEEAIALAAAFLEKTDVDEWRRKYPDLTYEFINIKPEEEGWVLRFYRLREGSALDLPFANMYVNRTNGETKFKEYGIVQTEAEAVDLARAVIKEMDIHREEYFKRKYPDQPKQWDSRSDWEYRIRQIETDETGWLIEFQMRPPAGIDIHPDVLLIYVYRETGAFEFRDSGLL